MNSGKYVFAQILQFVNKYEFEKCVSRYKGDHRDRDLNCWNQYIHLFFGQITSRNSLRDICLCLKANRNKLYHLGTRQNVNQSTLSRANENLDWRIFADFGEFLIKTVRPIYSDCQIPNIDNNEKYLLLSFITINFGISSLEIARLYHNRRQFEYSSNG
jgi:hypothetical protein